jgi:hypothetical protein
MSDEYVKHHTGLVSTIVGISHHEKCRYLIEDQKNTFCQEFHAKTLVLRQELEKASTERGDAPDITKRLLKDLKKKRKADISRRVRENLFYYDYCAIPNPKIDPSLITRWAPFSRTDTTAVEWFPHDTRTTSMDELD